METRSREAAAEYGSKKNGGSSYVSKSKFNSTGYKTLLSYL
jgi:hypothetical protein